MLRRRRKLTELEIKMNAQARELREKNAMTCQVCGRRILAETGKIAHHGYTRPGDGWQSSSCFGARHSPFEVNRERLGLWIEALENGRRSVETQRSQIANEEDAIRFSYIDYSKPAAYGMRRDNTNADLNRANFENYRNEPKLQSALRSRGIHKFDDLKKQTLESIDRRIQQASTEIEDQRRRYDGWKPTHARVANEWIKVDPAPKGNER